MSYSNIYDVIPICRTHARTEPVRTPKFSSDNASDKRQLCRLSLALSLPVRSHPEGVNAQAFTPLGERCERSP